jgi:hypothetical protein
MMSLIRELKYVLSNLRDGSTPLWIPARIPWMLLLDFQVKINLNLSPPKRLNNSKSLEFYIKTATYLISVSATVWHPIAQGLVLHQLLSTWSNLLELSSEASTFSTLSTVCIALTSLQDWDSKTNRKKMPTHSCSEDPSIHQTVLSSTTQWLSMKVKESSLWGQRPGGILVGLECTATSSSCCRTEVSTLLQLR